MISVFIYITTHRNVQRIQRLKKAKTLSVCRVHGMRIVMFSTESVAVCVAMCVAVCVAVCCDVCWCVCCGVCCSVCYSV